MSARRHLGRFDVAIVGSGFAGSILARLLARRGRTVALLERGRHPRFALGESSTPLAALALERLAAAHDLPDLHALAAWGRWRRRLPHLGRGRKRGFTFYHHAPGQAYVNGPANEGRLLVAASPDDESSDCHWKRADVDADLARRAAAAGARLFEECTVEGVEVGGAGARLVARRRGETVALDAGRLVDATGRAGTVARALGARAQPPPVATSLIYAHVTELPALAALAPAASFDPGPYDDEAAAVHHLVAGGWVYVLRFDDGVASVGLVLDDSKERQRLLAGGDPEAVRDRVLATAPTCAALLAASRPLRPWAVAGELAHRLDRAGGERWLALPHTLAFVDPMFSTGIAWSLAAVERLVEVLAGDGDADAYTAGLAREADQIAALISAARLARPVFAAFVAVTWIYFATVSWAEIRQRLLREAPGASDFLGVGDPLLEDLPRATLARVEELAASGFAAAPLDAFRRWAAEVIAPRDLGGFALPARHNLHPVDLALLVDRAALLGLSPATIRPLLGRLRGDGPEPP